MPTVFLYWRTVIWQKTGLSRSFPRVSRVCSERCGETTSRLSNGKWQRRLKRWSNTYKGVIQYLVHACFGRLRHAAAGVGGKGAYSTPNAREDLPEPDTPAIPTIFPSGISTSIFFRLWTFAPRISILSIAVHPSAFCRFGIKLHFKLRLCARQFFRTAIGAVFFPLEAAFLLPYCL